MDLMKTGYGDYLLRSHGYNLLSTGARPAEHEADRSYQCAETMNGFGFTLNFSICVTGTVQGRYGYVS